MLKNIIDANELINAFIEKQKKEHPSYDDLSGSMTYWEIIRFIETFAKEMK